MPKKKSIENVPYGFEAVINESGDAEIMKRTTIYMTPTQIEFFEVLGYKQKRKKNWLMQEVIKKYMEEYPDIIEIAKANVESTERK